MAGETENTPEYYLERAGHMRDEATRVHNEELRLAYLALAADWAKLAEMVKKSESRKPF